MCADSHNDSDIDMHATANDSQAGTDSIENVRKDGTKVKSENIENVRKDGTKVKSENIENVRKDGTKVKKQDDKKSGVKHTSSTNHATETETNNDEEDPCQRNQMIDISHVKGPLDYLMFIFTCKEGSRKCTDKREHFHCALCPLSKVELFTSTIKHHIESSHLNGKRIVVHRNINILPCKRIHPEKPLKKSYVLHYHCPECGSAIQQKSFFEKHLNTHQKKNSRPPDERQRSTKRSSSKSVSKKTEESSDLEDVPQANVRRTHPSERVQCEVCNAFITAKNMNRHNKTKHNLKPYTAICCDRGRGLYMVRRSHHGGVGFPIHVQKIVNSKRGNVIDCEVASCRTQMEIAERSGMRGRECSHLLLVNDASYPPEMMLDEDTLNELSASNKFRLLKPETVENCLRQHEMAIQNDSPPVVEWEEDNHIHLSVYDGSKHKFFPVRTRCIVTYNKSKQQLDCRCGLNRCFCLHKAMAVWYLYQTERVGNPIDVGGEMDSEHESVSADEYNSDSVKEHGPDEELDTIMYPPDSEDAAIRMINYMKTHKRILFPPLDWHKTLDPKELPVCYKPTELHCHECKDTLSGPFKITDKARIVTMTSLVEGVETYFKICKRCNNYYRYQ